MNKYDVQKQLERDYNKENLGTLLEPMKESIMKPIYEYKGKWLAQEFDFVKRPDLMDVYNAVSRIDIETICWPIITKVLLDESMSLQGVMGMFFNEFGKYCPMPYRRGHILNVYIEAMVATGLISVRNLGKYNHLVANITMGDRGQQRYSYTLPSIVPHKVKRNKDVAYDGMHVITGGKLKQHNHEVCLDHIERLSNIAYKVEDRIMDMTRPVFDDAPKFKERKGRFETSEEIEERRKDFIRFTTELPSRISIMQENGNEFYYGYRYCVRLRTYLKAYHFDFIGNKYCRAFVQPVKGELVKGAEEYL